MDRMRMSEEDAEDNSNNWFTKIAQQLSVITVIIIIAGGILTCLLLFIFAKRQIMRFALRSHRGPQVPFGTDTNKVLRREILRRIDALPKITYEPKMLRDDDNSEENGLPKPCHYYRMKVVDATKTLEQAIVKRKLGKRQSFESLRSYLMIILSPHVDAKMVHQFCDIYEAARFNPQPFNEEDYKMLSLLLTQLSAAVVTLQPKNSVRSPGKLTVLTSKVTGSSHDDKYIPQVRRQSKDGARRRWSFGRSHTEEHPLCETPRRPSHEIFCSANIESTIV